MIQNDSYSKFKLQSVHVIKASEGEQHNLGTCFAIGEKHVVTALHVVKGYNEYSLFSSYDDYKVNNKVELKLISQFSDENLDFSILEVVDDGICLIPIGVCESIQLSKGLDIDMCGYPREKKSHATVTSVVTEDLQMVKENKFSFELAKGINVTNYKGMSGSPVLYKGYAIGYLIVQSSGNLLYAISFSEVIDKFHELKSECSINIASQEEVNFIPDACPETPLRIEYTDKKNKPNISGLHIGFDFDEWREDDLIESSIDWIIDYALTPIQKKAYQDNPNYLKKNKIVWNDLPEYIEKNLPNLLLHMAIRKHYKTIPIVNSVLTLTKSNDFSCSHIIVNNGKLEIWLGVSTFDLNINNAVLDVISKIKSVVKGSTLKQRLILMNNSVDATFPLKDRLLTLGNNELDISDRVDRIVIPVFISHNSDVISIYDKENFYANFKNEVINCKSIFNENFIKSSSIDIKIFHFPARCTDTLSRRFEEEVIGMKELFK
ncbi:Hachiman antiphage defense system protein HamA [Vibrio vulnificus]|uniref:Hachiman antiphage defense system protein HamA n=1 Tax=Vibrio vulnificus TaxID=672 RepID=UPI001A354607|nr:Hachiman antiphage defense system protein HamA [Vibrio vulnificus]EGQ7852052.1 DUF1837 domain-containing protein [Vibrio vulnificus]EHD0099908.1 DUF1837 domain-containing protein [Vibrio vulnificus]MCA3939422.1 DUF1837 domain-containing protein [Vibrio vulnificus]